MPAQPEHPPERPPAAPSPGPQQHPTVGPIGAIRPTTRFARTPAELALPAPELGQHSAELLQEAGFSADEVGALRDAGIMGAAPLPA